MGRVAILGGSYEARSIIANAQRCLNLYPEKNPEGAPCPYTLYPTPGLDLLVEGPAQYPVRGAYTATNGELYVVIGPNVYYVDSSFTHHLLGTIQNRTTPVSFQDNGLVMVLVDGTQNGYAIDAFDTRAMSLIVSDAFYGADKADVLDTFFLFNRPGTIDFYITLSNVTYAMLIGGTAFDPLDIAGKVGYPDLLMTLQVVHREIWLIGQLTTEIFYNSGAADFVFQQLPGAFIQHGTCAKYSVATQDLDICFLSQDKQGQRMVLKGRGYEVVRISTHAIENAFMTYSRVDDAIGYIYQQEGHPFYVLIFPTANKTWVFDFASEQWHERAYTDSNGHLNRHRSNCFTAAYGKSVVGDFQNGNLYAFNLDTYTDNGDAITRTRGFTHLIDDGNRISYTSFIADMEVGTYDVPVDVGFGYNLLSTEDDEDIDTEDDDGLLVEPTPIAENNPGVPGDPMVSLRWSDDYGKTWGNRVEQSLGRTGKYRTSIQWNRLGLARDRVFELSWSAPVKTALNGAFIDAKQCAT